MKLPRLYHCHAAVILCATASLHAANIIRYDDRTAFIADTAFRTQIDFETLRNTCVAIPDAGGVTLSGVNFSGGVSRGTANGPCQPGLTPWSGYVLTTRVLIRSDIPAQAVTTATLPQGVTAVGFEAGINSDPVTSRISVTISTSDNKEETFILAGKGTGTGGARRVEPLFVGFTSSRPITAVHYRLPDIVDANLILDNFITSQSAAPVVNPTAGVVNGASFQGTFAPNTWITIFGRLFSGTSRPWAAQDFAGSRLPTSVDDVSVSLNGKAAYVYYVSPGQLNVLTPVDLPEGPVSVEVSRGALKSSSVNIQAQRVAPGLFRFDAENGRYAAVTHANGSLVGKAALYPGATTPARPGEIITLWGTGLGRTEPAIPAGEIVAVPARLIATPVVTIGAITADVQYAGLTGSGLYQINVRVPDAVPDGDVTVLVQIEGVPSQENAFITVQH